MQGFEWDYDYPHYLLVFGPKERKEKGNIKEMTFHSLGNFSCVTVLSSSVPLFLCMSPNTILCTSMYVVFIVV